MARALFLNAILSGKLGGTVYAHNKAGPYVRQFSMPTNPNTLAQAAARDEFASAVTLWQAMNPAQKGAWNSYAAAYYKAKEHDPTVLYSGFNAFVSLCNAARNALRLRRPTMVQGSGTENLTVTHVESECSQTPPVNTFSADIKDSAGDPLAIGANSMRLFSNGDAMFDITHHAEGTAVVFEDPVSGMRVGYNLYASNIIQQSEQFVTKPNLTLIGNTGNPEITAGWTESHDCVRFTFNDGLYPTGDHKLWYAIGDVIRMEVWQIGRYGPIIRIGEEVITVEAVPW